MSGAGGFTLPHRSDDTLGRGPRSEPRAPMRMVSSARSLGFRVSAHALGQLAVRIRGTLEDIDPFEKVSFTRARSRVKQGPL